MAKKKKNFLDDFACWFGKKCKEQDRRVEKKSKRYKWL
jgi:hypothetical protein